jgi:hypothetical protein
MDLAFTPQEIAVRDEARVFFQSAIPEAIRRRGLAGAPLSKDDLATSQRILNAHGWLLDGEKSLVLHSDVADTLIATARTGGARRGPAGIGLFLVESSTCGVTRRGMTMIERMFGDTDHHLSRVAALGSLP